MMAIAGLRRTANRVAIGTVFLLIGLLGPVSVIAPVRMFDAAQAQGPGQATDTGVLQPRSYQMPLGEAAPSTSATVEIPRPRIPIGDDALEQIKRNAPSGPRTGTPVPPAAGGPPQESVSTNCTTNNATVFTPSDIHGAVGSTNLITMTNVDIGVFNKSTCALVSRVPLNTFFLAGANEQYFDPQALYDPTVGRFIVTAESCIGSCDTVGVHQNQGFAVSTDDTGTSWVLYIVPINNGTNTFCVPNTTTFWDYPHVGSINGSAGRWFIAANLFPASGPISGSILAIEKAPTLTGISVTVRCFNTVFNTAPPNVRDSSNTAYFLSPGSGGGSSITRYAYATSTSGIGSDTLTTTSAITVPAWTAAPAAPQPNGTMLDTLDGRFQSQTIQNGTSLWNVHAVAVSGPAAARLYQLSTTATTPLLALDLFTSITDSVFNPSVATNATQAWVNASRTDPGQPSSKGNAAMLMFNGPNNADGWGFNLIATSGSQYVGCSVCRWGDYSSTQIDPSNGILAWGFNQLITGPNQFSNWTTRAARVTAGAFGSPVNSHDFNGNLMSDILWRDNNSGGVAMWLMNGGTVASSLGIGNVTLDWQIVGQRDFDGDGTSDILWRNGNTGGVAMWLMNGGTILSSLGIGNVSTNWQIVGTGDFDGDGDGDILWRDNKSGGVVMWLMNGGTVVASLAVGNVPLNWVVAGVRDFNGDGKWDILWRDNSSGGVCLTSSAMILSAVVLGNPTTKSLLSVPAISTTTASATLMLIG
jgi:VCBS repeat protein